ncbi:MAG: hypothetical protein RR050_01885 [Bacilli bacterium]
MNKTVYKLLKSMFESLDQKKKEKIIKLVETNLSEDQVFQYNTQFNSKGKRYLTENEIKHNILSKYKNLFSLEEYHYYLNLLSLKIFLKK